MSSWRRPDRGRKRLKSSRRRWLKCQSPRADAGAHKPTRERTSREACRRRSHRCAVSAVAGATDHDSVGRATASCARKQSAPRRGGPVSRLRVQVVSGNQEFLWNSGCLLRTFVACGTAVAVPLASRPPSRRSRRVNGRGTRALSRGVLFVLAWVV